MKKGDILFRALVLIICIGLPLFTFAQPDPPGDTPIDGGLSLLLAAGVGYGVKKYRERKKGEDKE